MRSFLTAPGLMGYLSHRNQNRKKPLPELNALLMTFRYILFFLPCCFFLLTWPCHNTKQRGYRRIINLYCLKFYKIPAHIYGSNLIQPFDHFNVFYARIRADPNNIFSINSNSVSEDLAKVAVICSFKLIFNLYPSRSSFF